MRHERHTDDYVASLAIQDQTRAGALDQLRAAPMFAVSTMDNDGNGALAVSLYGDGSDCANFILTTIVNLWEALHDVTGESDAQMVVSN